MDDGLLAELEIEYKGLVSLKNHKTSKSNLRESGIGILVDPLLTLLFILSAAFLFCFYMLLVEHVENNFSL